MSYNAGTDLINHVPVDAVVLGQRVDEVGGRHAKVYPRAVYRYSFAGQAFQSEVIRHPNYTRSNVDEKYVGEVRFTGPNRHLQAKDYLTQFSVGQKVTAWVNPSEPQELEMAIGKR